MGDLGNLGDPGAWWGALLYAYRPKHPKPPEPPGDQADRGEMGQIPHIPQGFRVLGSFGAPHSAPRTPGRLTIKNIIMSEVVVVEEEWKEVHVKVVGEEVGKEDNVEK